MGRKGFVLLVFLGNSPSLKAVRAGAQTQQTLEAEMDAETMEGRWLASQGLLGLLSCTARTTFPRVTPPMVSWDLPHPSSVKKMPPRLSTVQSGGGLFPAGLGSHLPNDSSVC